MSTTDALLLLVVTAPVALSILAAAMSFRLLRREREPVHPPSPPAPEPTEESVAAPEPADAPAPDVSQLLHARLLTALATRFDRDKLLDVVLESAILLSAADAVAVALAPDGRAPVVRTRNLAAAEPPPSLGETGEPPPPRAVAVQYDYAGDSAGATAPIVSGLLVPLFTDEGATIGTLGTYWRSPHEPSTEELRALEGLAAGAAEALARARAREAQEEELDAFASVTGLG